MNTTTRTIADTAGGKHEIVIPVGSLDRPTDECRRIMDEHADPRGWKYPVRPFVTTDEGLAEDYAYCLDFYVGGHETFETCTPDGRLHVITSKGYYHYVGA